MTPEGLESLVVVPPWKTAWPSLIALLLALAGAWGLRRQLRPSAWLGGVLVLALLVRVLLMPIGLHEYDGHEAEYLDLWMGRRALTQGGTLLYPAMQWLYVGLGRLAPFEQGPVLLNLGLSLLSIAAVAGFAERLAGPRVALVAGLALALLGNHAFWSSSAYNVMLPHALCWVSLWALACWIRGAPSWASGLLAGGCAALAVGTRLESILVAPTGLLLLLAYRPRGGLAALPGLLGGAAMGAFSAWYVLLPGEPPGSGQRAIAFAMNAGLLDYFAPFDRLPLALLTALGVGLAGWRAPRLALPVLLLVLGTHAASATFDDYGFRHLLNAQAALALLLGFLLQLPRWGAVAAALLAGALLMVDSWEVRTRYYASEEAFAASLDPALPVWGPNDLEGCALVCEDSRVVPEGEQRSHFNLLDPDEVEALREPQGCIYWLASVQDHRLSSRGVRDRALRLQSLFALEPVAVVKDGGSGYVGLVVEVGARRPVRPWNPTPTPGI